MPAHLREEDGAPRISEACVVVRYLVSYHPGHSGRIPRGAVAWIEWVVDAPSIPQNTVVSREMNSSILGELKRRVIWVKTLTHVFPPGIFD